MGGNYFVVVFIAEEQMFMSFYDYIPKKDFVSLPGNFWETVYHAVSLRVVGQDTKYA